MNNNHLLIIFLVSPCLLLLFSSTTHAQQNITFYLEPTVDYLAGADRSSSEEVELKLTTFSSFSPDSAYQIRRMDTYTSAQTTFVRQSFGGGLRGMMEVPIGDKLQLRTGVGVRYERFELQQDRSFMLSIPGATQDTIGKFALTTVGVGGSGPCVTVYEGGEDLSGYVPVLSNILLEVPVSFRYEVIPNQLGCSLGAVVVTPLRSTYEYLDREFNVQDHPDAPAGQCATVVSLETNATGERTADFQFATEVSMDFLLTDRLRVVLTASRTHTNRFVKNEADNFFFSNSFTGNYKPLRASIGVQWNLSGGNAAEID